MSTPTSVLFDVLTVGNIDRIADFNSESPASIISQYAHSEQVQRFGKTVFDHLDLTEDLLMLVEKYIDIDTAQGVGLDLLASWVGVSREGTAQNGTLYRLSDESLRALVRFKARANIGDSSLASINAALTELFGLPISLIDNQNMTLTFPVPKEISAEQLWILREYGLIIRGSGVGLILQWTDPQILGFYGQEISTFDIGIFNYEVTDGDLS